MTITTRVQAQLFETNERRPIRIAPSIASPAQTRAQTTEDDFPAIASRGTPWSADEHERFLDALARFPSGPWKRIAAHVGSRTARQTMSHAQKYRQKIKRRQRYVARQNRLTAVSGHPPTALESIQDPPVEFAGIRSATAAEPMDATAAGVTPNAAHPALSSLGDLSSVRAHADTLEFPLDSLFSLMVDGHNDNNNNSAYPPAPWHEPHMETLLPMAVVPALEPTQNPLEWYALAAAATARAESPVEPSSLEW